MYYNPSCAVVDKGSKMSGKNICKQKKNKKKKKKKKKKKTEKLFLNINKAKCYQLMNGLTDWPT